MSDAPEILIIHETMAQSMVRDASTVAMFFSLVMVGIWLESDVLQWVGAIIGFIVIVLNAVRLAMGAKMTVAEARKRLDEIEARK